MYDGECAGLEALSNTQIVRVPKHMKVRTPSELAN